MSRVLITGGAGALGAAVARRLLADPAYDVRISDRRQGPQWMREGCEMHRGDLRVRSQAAMAIKGCTHIVHLDSFIGDASDGAGSAYSLLEYEAALHNSIIGAAVERGVARLLYVSSPLVFERAELFPTPEEHLVQCLPPRSARGFARLSGERFCAAAHAQHGLQYTTCRAFGAYGPEPEPEPEPDGDATTSVGRVSIAQANDLSKLIDDALRGVEPLVIAGTGEQKLTPTHVDDLADGIVAALGSPAALGEDFNLSSGEERTLAEILGVAWQAGGGRVEDLALERLPGGEEDVQRSLPATRKAQELLGWEAQIELADGVATLAAAARGRASQALVSAAAGR
ncbi:MAG TPA: NAD(P)-dependent oxidoreductase [Solirubrobacteraceae bacterium]|jgi:UDP-glucose 4-epimerase|nr:NAD(P)-dependent oxidoreductase [Solirubrobacteraceae bacterium]